MSRQVIISQLGKALSLNGTSTTARLSGVLSSSTADWTACAWIYLAGTPSGTQTIVKNGETGAGNGGWQFALTSASKMRLLDPGGVWGGTAATAMSNTTWYHVAFIKKSNVTQMYLNAVADGATVANTFNNPQVDFTIGCTRNSSTGLYSAFFNGYIDDVRVWTRAISTDELTYVYTQDQVRFAGTSNLQGWWKFDEASGDGTDSSGNGRTVTVTNGARVTGHQYIANIPARTVSAARTVSLARTVITQ